MSKEDVKLIECFDAIKKRVDFVPDVAIVLGSGLGDLADEIEKVIDLSYYEIDGFPVSTVQGHDGRFIFGYLAGVKVVCMKGRIHYYEGYPMSDVVLPIRLMKLMGAKTLVLTNACGGLSKDFNAGDLMVILDHISCFVPNPLRGENIDLLGPRFPDMSLVYDNRLCELIKDVAKELDIKIKEGIYLQYPGPSYETPAEIKMFKMLGADVVGMSTAVEAIVGNHMGMNVCGISCITNLASGILPVKLSHEEVQLASKKTAPIFKELIKEVIKRI